MFVGTNAAFPNNSSRTEVVLPLLRNSHTRRVRLMAINSLEPLASRGVGSVWWTTEVLPALRHGAKAKVRFRRGVAARSADTQQMLLPSLTDANVLVQQDGAAELVTSAEA